MSGGYCDCSCRDCFEIAIEGDEDEGEALCNACEDAGCTAHDGECDAPHAYCGDAGEDDEGYCVECGLAF